MDEQVIITGMGHQYPSTYLDNDFFESLEIGSSAQWVEDRTGIKGRYSVLSLEHIRKLKDQAVSFEELRKDNQIPDLCSLVDASWTTTLERDKCELLPDILICGTSVPDYQIPAQASLVAKKLGIGPACFDVNSACSSFVTNLSVAKGMMQDRRIQSAAIFNVERYTTCLDYSDRRNCVLFGDGSASAILRKGKSLRGFRVLDTILHSDPSGSELVQIPMNGYFYQNGARVQKFAISRTCEVTEEIVEQNQLKIDDIRYFIGHQANLRMLTSACNKLGLEAEKHLYNVDTHGNQGAAGAPSVLSLNWNRFKDGDIVVVSVVGSGLTWGSALLQFQDP